MSLILNSTLPAGSRGLWWFAQGPENLAPVATGDAVLSGSILSGGRLVHNDAGDVTVLAADSTLVLPTSAITILMRAELTSFANEGMQFTLSEITDTHRVLTHINDADITWDFGGSAFEHRITQGGLSLGTSTPHIFGYTAGARGIEIWLDSVKLQTGSVATRTGNAALAFQLGRNATNADTGAWDWLFIHESQLDESLITDIMNDPEGQLTEGSLAAVASSPMKSRRLTWSYG